MSHRARILPCYTPATEFTFSTGWLLVVMLTELSVTQPLLPHMTNGQMLASFFGSSQMLASPLNQALAGSFTLLSFKSPGLLDSVTQIIVINKADCKLSCRKYKFTY